MYYHLNLRISLIINEYNSRKPILGTLNDGYGEDFKFIIKDQCQAFYLGRSTHSMFLRSFVCVVFMLNSYVCILFVFLEKANVSEKATLF